MPKIDLTKPVQTRRGRPVRILATDLRSDCPVVGIVSFPDYDEVETWTLDGTFVSSDDNDEHPDDLVNVPVETRRYFPTTRGLHSLQCWDYAVGSCEAIGFDTLQECRDSGYLGPVVEVVFVDGQATAANLIGGSDAKPR